MSRRGLQVTLAVLGSVAVVAGTATLLTGAALIPGDGTVSPSIDSELRFYAAWYVAAGVVLLRTVPRVETEGTTIRAIAAVFFVAAAARLLSMITVGTPHWAARALMVIEFAIPLVLIPWQATVARQAPDRRPDEAART